MASRQEPKAPTKGSAKMAAPKIKRGAAPTRDLFSTGGFDLSELKVEKVGRALELNSANHDMFIRYYNFFAAHNTDLYKEIEAKYSLKRDGMTAWIAATMGSDVLSCVNYKPNGKKEDKGKILDVLVVTIALSVSDEDILSLKYQLGELDGYVTNRYRPYALRSKKQQERRDNSDSPYLDEKQVAHTLGLGLVRALVDELPPEHRVGDQHLKEILNRDSNMRLVLVGTNQKLHKRVDNILKSPVTPGESYAWTAEERSRLRQIAKQVQSDQFQQSMIDVRGDHLYDAIRTRLKQADPTVWKDEKDKVALRRANILSRDRYAAQVKPKKLAERRKELHLKGDNTPDLRFKENRELRTDADSRKESSPPPAPVVATPRRARGSKTTPKQPDSREAPKDSISSENKAKSNTSSSQSSSAPARLKADGTPDLRFRSNKTQAADAVSSSTTNPDSSERVILTGPRGGKYYIDAKGKKRYI